MSCVVVMGVSGSGKSTIASLLADRLGWRVADGDDFHPSRNIKKMTSGIPLADTDRVEWLAAVRAWIDERARNGTNAVISCSALTRNSRDVLRRPDVVFVFLMVSKETLVERISGRCGHFMPLSLLESQLATLEPPFPDEMGIHVDAYSTPGEIVDWLIPVISDRFSL